MKKETFCLFYDEHFFYVIGVDLPRSKRELFEHRNYLRMKKFFIVVKIFQNLTDGVKMLSIRMSFLRKRNLKNFLLNMQTKCFQFKTNKRIRRFLKLNITREFGWHLQSTQFTSYEKNYLQEKRDRSIRK